MPNMIRKAFGGQSFAVLTPSAQAEIEDAGEPVVRKATVKKPVVKKPVVETQVAEEIVAEDAEPAQRAAWVEDIHASKKTRGPRGKPVEAPWYAAVKEGDHASE